MCFEEADVVPELAERTVRLCERIGYYGAFEVVFILCRGRPLLIDFNGRFYNQLAFDIARGMDLPSLVYAASTGQADEVARLTSAFLTRSKTAGLVFCNGFGLSVTLAAQQASRAISPDDARRWKAWRKAHAGRIIDAVRDAADPLPALIDVAQQLLQSVRHPRAFAREMAPAKWPIARIAFDNLTKGSTGL